MESLTVRSRSLLPWGLVVLACMAAFLVRSEPARSRVFGEPDVVSLQGNDAWAHSRTVEFLVRNFPQKLTFDPYSGWPNGQPSGVAPLFDFLVASSAIVIGRGVPSEVVTRTALAWAPVVFGALIPLPVFGLTRRLAGSEAAGVAAAWTVALMPGHFQLVSQLGFGDHHSLEGLLASCGMLALAGAVESESGRRLPWTAAAVAAWSAYLAAWVAGALMIGIIVLWAGLELLLAHLRRDSATAVVRAVAAVLLVGGASTFLTTPHAWSLITHVALTAGLAALLGLLLLFHLADRANAAAWAAPAAALVLAAASVAGFALFAPAQFAFLVEKSSLMKPDTRFATVAELRPLLRLDSPWFWTPLWEQFRFAFPLGVIGAAVLWRGGGARLRPEVRLFLVWSGLMLLLTLSQMRSSYYLAINLAVLSGIALRALAVRIAPGGGPVALAALLVATSAPSLLAVEQLNGPGHPILRDYRKVCRFLRTETPEPFGDPEAYFRPFAAPPAGQPFEYPSGAYGVMNWWDSGHALTALARRIPVSNPYQAGAEIAARFYLEQDPSVAVESLRARGVRYVLAGPDLLMNPLGMITPEDSKIDTMHPWVGATRDSMVRLARRADSGEPLLVFFPPYFHAMAVRLSLFAGRGTDGLTRFPLLRLRETDDQLLLLEERYFGSQPERTAFLAANESDGWRIASADPYHPCVAVGPVPGLELVFKSQFVSLPAVKVFEVQGR